MVYGNLCRADPVGLEMDSFYSLAVRESGLLFLFIIILFLSATYWMKSIYKSPCENEAIRQCNKNGLSHYSSGMRVLTAINTMGQIREIENSTNYSSLLSPQSFF